MTTLQIKVKGLETADRSLRRFASTVADLTPFWAELAESLATDSQSRWPLRRRSGRLRESLRWAGGRLGEGGIFETSPDRLRFGSSVFYGRFAQFGTKRQRKTPLVHVDAADASAQLIAWARQRATDAGLEVE